MTNKSQILLVEDETHIAESLQFNLETEYNVIWAQTGEDALVQWKKNKFDLIVLDVMLPKKSGYDVCAEIRKTDSETAILFLTAKGDARDRIEGLKLGADDYLGKPFELDEFLLRVKALLKRRNAVNESSTSKFSFDKNEIDFENYVAVARGKKIQLTPKECMLMKLLIERQEQVVTREEILMKVWGYEAIPSTRTVDNFIVRLRNYFEVNPKDPTHIISVHGVGYKFVP